MYFKNCVLCGGNINELTNYGHAYLVKCNSCKFVFSKRIPSPEELTAHYTNYPRYTSLSPHTEKRYHEILDILETYRNSNNLLDIGCSNGLFLECAKKRGWNVYGTEYAQESIDYCAQKNIKVFKSDKLPEEFYKITFDVVTSFEVIEHINTPNEEAEFVNKILRKGGAFYFTTPNFNSISRFLLKEKWNIIEYPEHLSYFTPSTAHQLMMKHGFKKQFIQTTGVSISRFKQSMQVNNENNTNRENVDELLRDKIENNPFLTLTKKAINFFLNLFKIGDAMKALYIKP